MRRFVLMLSVVVLASCGGAPVARTSPSSSATVAASATPSASPSLGPTPTPSHTVYGQRPAFPTAVIEDIWTGRYTVTLVSANGTIIASIGAMLPSVMSANHVPAPLVSISSSRVYYLDGDVNIKYLTSAGDTGAAARYPGGPQTAVGFAVSPDDQKIAYGLINYSAGANHPRQRFYIESPDGSSHVDLNVTFTSTAWPVAWYAGRIVFALGPAQAAGGATNPYQALDGYAVVDPSLDRIVQQIGPECAFGPLNAGATVCWNSTNLFGYRGLDGTLHPFAYHGDVEASMALAPDAGTIAAQVGATGQPIVLFYPSSNSGVLLTAIPMGWLDKTHIVFQNPPAEPGFHRRIIDITTRSITPIPDCPCGNSGIFMGVLG